MFYVSLGVIGLGFLMCSISVLKSDNFKQKFAEKKAQKLEDEKLKGRNKEAMALRDDVVNFIDSTRNTLTQLWVYESGTNGLGISGYGRRREYKAALQEISAIVFLLKTNFDSVTKRLEFGNMPKEKVELFQAYFDSNNFTGEELEEISYLVLLKIYTFFPSFIDCLVIFQDDSNPTDLRDKTRESMWDTLNEVTIDTLVPILEIKKENKEIERTVYEKQLDSLKESIELDREVYNRYKGN